MMYGDFPKSSGAMVTKLLSFTVVMGLRKACQLNTNIICQSRI